ncbi:MAG TPA: hypothetical protein PK079_15920 [Leptospiraceae bacterium]|nr:hypothetical protein [Leptospiraceae bacterium]HMW07657.1 hypothetical protein [Leptospiraceae bacterium]HMX35488.1 hypothetical protein [Leptospiraceae bacterium]HMY33329.1 hypothetical protein [Leptospiraceae bacterium]HMZ63066.1 hypothetical protein [Leptospiraceae bacterium]
MEPVLALEKIKKLPPFLQDHLEEYIDFLYIRYVATDSNFELSEKGKQILDARWEEHLKNKNKAKTWIEFKKELNGKHI